MSIKNGRYLFKNTYFEWPIKCKFSYIFSFLIQFSAVVYQMMLDTLT